MLRGFGTPCIWSVNHGYTGLLKKMHTMQNINMSILDALIMNSILALCDVKSSQQLIQSSIIHLAWERTLSAHVELGSNATIATCP